jgi:trehalose synthase-fused probable maltokinase
MPAPASLPDFHWLESEILPAYLQRSRWFGGKARAVQSIALAEVIECGGEAALAVTEVRYAHGEPELYQIPVLSTSRGNAASVLAESPAALISERGDRVLLDALFSAEFRAALWQRVTHSAEPAPESRVLAVEQSNSSLLYGGRVFVKVFRRIQSGVNPDAEILRFLTEERKFPHVPAFVGAFERAVGGRDKALLAIAIAAVPNRGDAWSFALAELRDFHSRAGSEATRDADHVRAIAGPFLARIAQLGTRTGALHVALGSATAHPDFAPEPVAESDLTQLRNAVLSLWEEVFAAAPAEHRETLAEVTPRVCDRALAFARRSIVATKTRTHGDYHLGQVLETGGDFIIIDFEGEPARPLAERRRKQSPVRDVAGMLRSLHYAAHAARPDDSPHVIAWAEAWTALAERTFLDAWRAATVGASFRPASDADLDFLLRAFLLEKAIYEIRYELNNRPTWLHIPLRGLERVLDDWSGGR